MNQSSLFGLIDENMDPSRIFLAVMKLNNYYDSLFNLNDLGLI